MFVFRGVINCYNYFKSTFYHQWQIPNQQCPSISQLVVSTHLKNISQMGNLSQIEMKIKNV